MTHTELQKVKHEFVVNIVKFTAKGGVIFTWHHPSKPASAYGTDAAFDQMHCYDHQAKKWVFIQYMRSELSAKLLTAIEQVKTGQAQMVAMPEAPAPKPVTDNTELRKYAEWETDYISKAKAECTGKSPALRDSIMMQANESIDRARENRVRQGLPVPTARPVPAINRTPNVFIGGVPVESARHARWLRANAEHMERD